MHVRDLLQSDTLGLTLLWGEEALLGQEISGVTATDLEDPGRFLGPGELVLSGLVWWADGDLGKADRFVSALAGAGATALLAGEETHGRVPQELVAACRAHRVPIVAVPGRTSFRAVTEAVYLRQWGDLSRRPARPFALPENVRGELSRLLEGGAEPAELLDRACAHLGKVDCYLLSASGRTVARTPSAPAIPAQRAAAPARGGLSLRVEADSSPYDAWQLHVPDADAAPPRVLHEIAEVLAQYREGRERRTTAAARAAGQALVGLLAGPAEPDPGALEEALAAAGLPPGGPYRVLAATSGPALAEALGHLEGVPWAAGESAAVLYEDPRGHVDVAAELRGLWPLLQACGGPEADLRLGAGAPAAGPEGLRASLSQARFALTAAEGELRVRAVEQLDTLAELLSGVPGEVRSVFGARTLGALGDGMLRETLEVFLANNCSWARTAEALHLHVNTVHYRMERVQVLTGRDLSRLDHKLDLYAALLCR
ncbi:helix-turn-helix domain-containing protein [Streptomyces sp. NBC_00091]|uniref:helix-turn-helix domain-containing protein n=1 Tax=Streptomyces sp. NBC_00091 TaxID=2975648 RepID=UPI002254E2BA|nr:helix-turn-helix domain-containing protein [Streptomyces sp. NBC_00091]MCX5377049.1 PucR family transcriptional regulator ligand-binding domain-containing protein [Streptomyces sp. NBC_00091]